MKVARLRVLGAPGVDGGGEPQPLCFPTLERIVATMAEDRDRLLDHALVEHRHEGLVVDGHQPARHDREIGCLVGNRSRSIASAVSVTAISPSPHQRRRLDRVGRHLDQ